MINPLVSSFYKPYNKKVQIATSVVDVILGVVLIALAFHKLSGLHLAPLMQHSFILGGSIYAGISLFRLMSDLKITIFKHKCTKGYSEMGI